MLQICSKRALLLALAICLCAGLAGPARAEAPVRLKVASFNIRNGDLDSGQESWKNRGPAVIELIQQMKPDVLCLQECLSYQRDQILKALPGLYSIGEGRELDGSGEMCCILIDASRFDFSDTGTFWLNEERLRGLRGWDAALPRIVTYAHLYDKQARRGFYVYNTHFDHRGEEARYQSALQIMQTIDDMNQANGIGLPVIICGDLNAAAGSKTVALLSAYYQDCFGLLHPGEKDVGTFNGFEGRKDGARIDYVLANSEFKVHEARIVRTSYRVKTRAKSGPRWASDHFPVIAELEFISH